MLKNLNEEQFAAVKADDKTVLVVAGAGTGKTTVLTEKIIHLIKEKNIPPSQILALAFNQKAAEELKTRVEDGLQLYDAELLITTFHGFAQELLEQYGLQIGLPNSFPVYSPIESWLMLKDNLFDLPIDYYRPLGNPTRLLHELIDHFSNCKDELIDPDDYLKKAQEIDLDNDLSDPHNERNRTVEIANLYHSYNQLLRQRGAVDFGDLLFFAVKLLSTRPSVLAAVHKRWRFILVDEFQDVNTAQYQLIKLLAQTANLTLVGDDDQSIYGWRGANVAHILNVKNDWPDLKSIVLTKNFRSPQNILDASHKLISANNPNRLEIALNINKSLIADTAASGEITVIHTQTDKEEVAKVIEKIQAAHTAGIPYSEIAILMRANNHGEPFIEALKRKGIPFASQGRTAMFSSPIILDCLALLRAATNLQDNLSYFRLLTMKTFYFPTKDLHQFINDAHRLSINYSTALANISEFKLSAPAIASGQKIIALIDKSQEKISHETPSAVFYFLLEHSGLLSYLQNNIESKNLEAAEHIRQINELFELIINYESTHPDSRLINCLNFIDDLAASAKTTDADESEKNQNAVSVLTVHKAKGLEFKIVFIINAVEGRFPARRGAQPIALPDELNNSASEDTARQNHLAEERRLFYVAMTRAKETLIISSARHYGEGQERKPSRFIDEAGLTPNHLNLQPERQNQPVAAPAITRAHSSTIMQIPKTFSYSQLNTFENCPYEYKMRYLLKIPSRGNFHFSFGTTIHTTLQAFYEKIQLDNQTVQQDLFTPPEKNNQNSELKIPSVKFLLELYEQKWIPNWYAFPKQRELYEKKGREMLKFWYEKQATNWTIPIAIESSFQIAVADCKLIGKIDRLDRMDNQKIKIIDYKTGIPKKKLEKNDKDQLLIYQLALSKDLRYRHLGQVGELAYLYLEDTSEQTFVGTENDLKKVEEKITTQINQIINTDFELVTKKNGCGRCEFCLVL